jgi:hypothetical protein
MNWSELQRDWGQFSIVLKTHWPSLTDDDLNKISGCRERLAQALRRRHGWSEIECENHICSFEDDVRYPGAVK